MDTNMHTSNLHLHLAPEQQGQYLTLPFELPEGVEELRLSYVYQRHVWQEEGPERACREINVINLGLIAPDGQQAGVSGANKIRYASAPYMPPQATTRKHQWRDVGISLLVYLEWRPKAWM